MISLRSNSLHGGGIEWECSHCQHCWVAPDPFGGCPECWRADQVTEETTCVQGNGSPADFLCEDSSNITCQAGRVA